MARRLFSDERIAECERIRATYTPKPVEWTCVRDDRSSQTGDFGDYSAGAWRDAYSDTGGIQWSVSRKIVNELLGKGRLHVSYGYAKTFDDAKKQVAEKVELDREKRAKEDDDA